jgi:hypothetical protein
MVLPATSGPSVDFQIGIVCAIKSRFSIDRGPAIHDWNKRTSSKL